MALVEKGKYLTEYNPFEKNISPIGEKKRLPQRPLTIHSVSNLLDQLRP
jgi:hypothetical protein